ncbi:hypothetical protein BDP27DRAFT_1322138 [Rhodocollybia butyracea]|uniref:DUF1793-domain-containing protein n=1 Tax=Rhodocollybia butyracea TaxID=206335 RepID=A0A9P5PY74_9AGAR|nr:hypothetical protein BDP27DRAFT_1322138 [Rhodocollybia butyracea]
MFFAFLFASFFLLASNQSIHPPAIPLAVRTPYFQAYLNHTSTNDPISTWPAFWTNRPLGWSGLLRVDGTPYEWLGRAVEDGNLTNQTQVTAATFIGYQVTPTRTIISLKAGAIALNVTFLSPIEPRDLVKQSLPFAYIYLEASSTDGKAHSMQIYQDLSAEWTSSNSNNVVQWNTTPSGSIIFHEVQRSPFQYMTELKNMSEDAVLYHVANNVSGLTYQTGEDVVVRSGFLNNGILNNTQDNFFRAINGSDWPVFAFCQNLGSIQSTSTPLVWGLGVVRSNDIIYATPSGNQTRKPYFFTEYPDVPTATEAFMSDATDALSRATTLDNKIISAANGISSNYADLVSLASRQVMAGMEITVGTSNGQINNSDVLFFMKDTGNSQRTNPVEVMYAAFPAFLYLNASWTAYLLEPLLQFESSGLSGNAFPAAIGDADPAVFSAIESTSDILTMAWAHTTFTGDLSLISRYYHTLKKWTDTLISETPLMPNGYVTADQQDLANMTNLAIKGILAIRTMAEIGDALGETDDSNSYSSTASSLLSQWQNLAGSSGHLTSTYGSETSWGLMYNMFPDKLFGFDFIPANIYSEQTTAGSSTFGLPFDSNLPIIAKSQWTLFTAATVNDTSIRDSLVSYVHSSASNLAHFAAFPTTYSITDGSIQGGTASPAQGAMYALLALDLPKQDISGSLNGSSKKSKTGAIAGGVVGGIAFVSLLSLAVFFYRRRRARVASGIINKALRVQTKETKGSSSQEALNGYRIEPFGSSQQNPTATSGGTSSRSNKPELIPYSGPLYPPVPITDPSRAPPHLHNADDGRLPNQVSSTTAPGSVPSSTSGPSTVGSSSDPASSSVAMELRNDVENLRREMQEIRSRTAYEPPPEYQ